MTSKSNSKRPSWLRRMIELACDLNAKLRRVPQVSVDEAVTMSSGLQEVVWIDVRSSAEQQVSMIEHAVPSETFDSKRLKENKALVVTYCTAGFRSGSFASQLRRQGIEAVNLRGGLFAWCEAQQPLVDHTGQPTQRVHIYGRSWNFVPENYEAVS